MPLLRSTGTRSEFFDFRKELWYIECTLFWISARVALSSLTSLSEDIELVPGARAGRTEADGCFADGARPALGAAAFFGKRPSVTEARGRGAAADLADVAESGDATDERGGAARMGLAVGEEDAAEDNLPDVEADNVDGRAGGTVDFPGSIDVLRAGAGTEEEVAVDDLGGIVNFEAGATVD